MVPLENAGRDCQAVPKDLPAVSPGATQVANQIKISCLKLQDEGHLALSNVCDVFALPGCPNPEPCISC